MIDNIKKIRNLNYFFKINKNLLNYNYIFFCYNINLKHLDSKIVNNPNIKYYFLKKLKCIKYLDFIKTYLNNSVVIFCINDYNSLNFFLQELNNNIIYCKINNSYYSLNNLKDYLNSKMDLIHYIDNNIIALLYNLQVFENKLKN